MKFFGVAIVAIDSRGDVILVGQYRHVLDRFTWEVPGGGVLLPNDPLVVAKSELQEETGWRAQRWLKVVQGSASPGSVNEEVSGYVAWDIEEGEARPDPEELLSIRRVPFSEAVSMALRGEVSNLIGVAALLGVHARSIQRNLPHDLLVLLKNA
jgi:8-oxo-dGTP pyrophosphatase MutT (NUDIX family)